MRHSSVLIGVGVCVLAGVVWFWSAGSKESADKALSDNRPAVRVVNVTTRTDESVNNGQSSPFSLDSASSESSTLPVESDSSSDLVSTTVTPSSEQGVEKNQPLGPAIDVTNLGRSAINDAEFLELTNALRNDAVLLQQLIDELRQETDPKRRATLARILGEVGGDSAVLTASELIYSGDEASRRIGLALLQQIQPGNAEARDIASTLLATEIEPAILVGSLTALARPGEVDDSSRRYLSDQVAFLTDHEDAKVRSISLSILSRWSKDGQYTEVLQNGLNDQEVNVRESAAYALVGHDNVSQSLIDSLLLSATNSAEGKQVRRGAILALKGMALDDSVRQQVIAAELELDTRR